MEERIKNTIETEKIIVSSDNELVDVLNKVEQSKAVRIILTFTEHCDVLISPINLKAIQDIADENKKILITQIVQNVVGVRNAKDAGLVVTEATGTILEEYWADAERGYKSRMRIKDEKLQSKRMEVREEVIEEKPEIEEERPREKSDFEKRIEDTLERAKQSSSNKQGKIVEQNGITFSLDQDIEQSNKDRLKENTHQPSLVGRDLSYFKTDSLYQEETQDEENSAKSNRVNNPALINIRNVFSKLPPINAQGFGQIALKLIIPLIALLSVSLWIVYTFVPLVKVRVYVEAKNINIEKVFSSPVGSQVFSYEDGVVPVKREEVSKEASGNTTPTGKAYKGNKAEGVVTLTYWKFLNNGGQPTTVPAGAIITTSGGLKYETVTAAKVGSTTPLSMTVDVAVRAVGVGAEYNLASGQPPMSVAGYTGEEMTAQNSAAISGGSKEEFTVFSQSDFDKIVKELRNTLYADLKTELDTKTEGGWEIISTTLKQELDGDPRTDIPVGGEGSIVNITVKAKTSAILYKRYEIESKIPEVLTKSAQEQNLFNSGEGLKLQMDSEITKEIKIESVKNDIVKLKLIASGKIKPEVNKDEILSSIKGLMWSDGINKLSNYSYSQKPSEVEFAPSYFPDFLKHFPSRQGRIILTIDSIKTE